MLMDNLDKTYHLSFMKRRRNRRLPVSTAPGRVARLRLPAAVLLIALAGAPAAEPGGSGSDDGAPNIARVFFAQHHVQTPDSPCFKLVGNLETLVKVHVAGTPGSPAPDVRVRLARGASTHELSLKGPARLPRPTTGDPALIEHNYNDCFTAFIPREWIRTGVTATVVLAERRPAGNGAILDSRIYKPLKVGAPTRLIMTMFDFHFFGKDRGADYPRGWFRELGSKLPVAELELRRVRNIILSPLVMPPRAGGPAILCRSRNEYQAKSGHRFDGEQSIAGRWNGALKSAGGAGWGGTRRLYYSNIYGVHSGGTGGGLSGRGNGKSVGILLHELGHAFGLPHWAGKKDYPYVGTMHGIPSDSETTPHVGPVWGFDLPRRMFLPPVHNGRYKRDPMQGGGANRSGGPHLMRFFSDYSVSRIQSCLERFIVVWDERARCYKDWNQDTGMYSDVARVPGRHSCPVEHDIPVISLLGSASLVTPEANIVYPPIGPCTAGLTERFEASSRKDRAAALARKYPPGCNLCLRVRQGQATRTYLLKAALPEDGDPNDGKTFAVFAMNLPARDGRVFEVDLLHTPAVMRRGLVRDSNVLYRRQAATSPGPETQTVAARYAEGTVTVLDPPRIDGGDTAATPATAARPPENGAAPGAEPARPAGHTRAAMGDSFLDPIPEKTARDTATAAKPEPTVKPKPKRKPEERPEPSPPKTAADLKNDVGDLLMVRDKTVPRYRIFAPAAAAAKQLEKVAGIAIRADWQALKQAGADLEEKVFLQGDGEKLTDILDAFLAQIAGEEDALAWRAAGGAIHLLPAGD